jgi:hypothetical protein
MEIEIKVEYDVTTWYGEHGGDSVAAATVLGPLFEPETSQI